jgi:hypothetical protein
MEFIIIFEENHKDHENYIHYCQWTGNEEELFKLIVAIDNADYEELLGGDYSSFYTSDVKIPEAAVDAHMKIKFMFYKHTGKFTCPSLSTDSYEVARDLDHYYYRGRLGKSFT